MQPAYTARMAASSSGTRTPFSARMAGGYSVTSQYQREMRIITPTPASVFMK